MGNPRPPKHTILSELKNFLIILDDDSNIILEKPELNLKNIRYIYLENEYLNKSYPRSIETIIKCYKNWVREHYYLIFRLPNENHVCYLASKRGNKAHVHRAKKRLTPILRMIQKSITISKARGFRNNYGLSNILIVTLTLDPSKFLWNIKSMWNLISYLYIDFCKGLKRNLRKLGIQFSSLRTIEAQIGKNSLGHPHINIVLVLNRPVLVKYHAKSNSWRLPNHDIIKSAWKYGFADIKAIYDKQKKKAVKHALNYVLKYCLKQINTQKHDSIDPINLNFDISQEEVSIALNWLFRKRSWSIYNKKLLMKLAGNTYDLNHFKHILPNESLNSEENIMEFIGVFKIYASDKVFNNLDPPIIIILKNMENYIENMLSANTAY